MALALETILLVVAVFAIGAVLGYVLRKRGRSRSAPPVRTPEQPARRAETAPTPVPAETPVAAEQSAPDPRSPSGPPSTPAVAVAAPSPPADGAEGAGLAKASASARRTAAERPAGRRPPAEAAPSTPDDLKKLKGIGPQNERKLNALGIYRYAQIAGWTPEEAQWVGAALGFPGRVERENWTAQARALLGEPAAAPQLPGLGPEGGKTEG
ncbi:hypothetical protein [Aquabacter spiritensis]|uniref:Putative flap endonuclease-1-like 5' DNA nuclease n=1 Tax=Aquabacter spiritensis TaxID=933073 RepID=A0A4R3LXW2_9HYPH|nr:hypothetical protein [Aquabacter spiritensis]TCT04619.1 putative flap endonuclease-1-like 5' DNA nuclease [Aquabacter spiritensis]